MYSPPGRPIDQDKLDFIYELKTGALLEASMMVGAVLAGAAEEEVSVIEKVASDVGICIPDPGMIFWM